MDDLEKYHDNDRVIEQKVVSFETPSEPDGENTSNLIKGVLRRWHIVLVTFVLICAIGIPPIWYLIEPEYRATAPIRVAPIIPNILFSDKDSERVMPLYDNFKSDQARFITTDQRILLEVADNLADEGLRFFENKNILPEKIVGLVNTLPQAISKKIITIMPEKPADPVEVLRQAIRKEIITAAPVRRSELIFINVISTKPEEAAKIATAFRSAYMIIEGSKPSQEEDDKLVVLENQLKEFAKKLNSQRETIRKLADEYGTVELDPRQQMMLQRVAALQGLLTKIEADKLLLGIKIELLKKTKDESIQQRTLLERRDTFIQNDLLVQMLTRRIAQLEEELISARQILSSENPKLEQRADLLETFKTNLEEHRKEVEKTFNESITEESSKNREASLADAELQLRGLDAQREILQAKIDKEDTDTIKLGRKQLDIRDQLDLIQA